MIDRRDLWRVATLNIWNRSGDWPARLALIRAELAALDLDVVGLQEVLAFGALPNQADDLVAGTGWHAFYAPARTLGPGLTLGNAILSRHPFTHTAVLPLPTPADKPDPRCVAFARVDAPHGPMPVFVTHLVHQLHLGDVRSTQVQTLAALVAEHAPLGGPPPVVMGDFNAEPDADEMRYLRGLTALGTGKTVYFSDCWIATHDVDRTAPVDPGYTYDRANPYARRAHEPSRRIDYIYVRGPDRNLRGEPLACTIAWNRPTGDTWPSDHFGLVAELYAAPRASE